MLEIDRERTLRADAEKEINRQRATLIEFETKLSARAHADAEELGHLRGKLKAAESDQTKRDEEIGQLRKQVSTLETIIARSEGEAAASRGYLLKLEDALKWSAGERSQTAAHFAMRTFNNIADLWKLTDAEIVGLLGAESILTVSEWRKSVRPIPADVVSRISQITAICKSLQTLYPDGAVATDSWIHQRLAIKQFGDHAPIEIMSEGNGGLEKLLEDLESQIASRLK